MQGSEFAIGYDIYCVGGLDGLTDKYLNDHRKAGQREVWESFGRAGFVELKPGDSFLFRTGFAMAIQPGYGCFFWDRSGLGGGKLVHRFAGVIDEDYRGEWFVRLVNFNKIPVTILAEERIVQGIFQERIAAAFPVVDELPASGRGTDGFGSTGQK